MSFDQCCGKFVILGLARETSQGNFKLEFCTELKSKWLTWKLKLICPICSSFYESGCWRNLQQMFPETQTWFWRNCKPSKRQDSVHFLFLKINIANLSSVDNVLYWWMKCLTSLNWIIEYQRYSMFLSPRRFLLPEWILAWTGKTFP